MGLLAISFDQAESGASVAGAETGPVRPGSCALFRRLPVRIVTQTGETMTHDERAVAQGREHRVRRHPIRRHDDDARRSGGFCVWVQPDRGRDRRTVDSAASQFRTWRRAASSRSIWCRPGYISISRAGGP